MNIRIRNLLYALLIVFSVFAAGCAEKEITTPAPTQTSTPSATPVSTLTGHEQGGEPNMSYPGLADVFRGKTGLNVSAASINENIDGVNLSGFLVQPAVPGKYSK